MVECLAIPGSPEDEAILPYDNLSLCMTLVAHTDNNTNDKRTDELDILEI